MNWGGGSLAESWSRRSDRNCVSPWTRIQGFQLLSDALGHSPTQVLHQYSNTAVLWEREVVEPHTVLQIKGLQCAGRDLEPVGR